MKKFMSVILALVLVLSMSTGAFAGEKGNDNGKGKGNTSIQQSFKLELNAQKKEIAQTIALLEEQREQLIAGSEETLTGETSEDSVALPAGVAELDAQIALLKADMKRIINERFMVTKTMYSDEELAQFENAAALIAKMYEDASVLGAGSVIVRENLIKLDTPAYIKGGRTIIPVRAITQQLGAEVTYDPATCSVNITKDGTTINLSINSTTATVNGIAQELDAAAEITNGRTYVPLRFIAETFGMIVTYDPADQTIDIESPEGSGTSDSLDDTPDETAEQTPAVE